MQEEIRKRSRRFEEALAELEAAPPFAKARYQTAVFRRSTDLLDAREGIPLVYEYAGRFDAAGVFHGGPWEAPAKLLPQLVGVGLLGDGVYPSVEALSELRVLAIAEGKAEGRDFSADEAAEFLREVVAKHLHLLYPGETEDRRSRPRIYFRAESLLRFIADHIGLEGLREQVIEEIELLCVQRPIATDRIRGLLEMARRIEPGKESDEAQRTLDLYTQAVGAPTAGSRATAEPGSYRDWIREAGPAALGEEARSFAESLCRTGLGSPFHPVLLRFLQKNDPSGLPGALGLSETGSAELFRNAELAGQLLRASLFPATADALTGFRGMLERGLLSRREVAGGLRRLLDLDILPSVREMLLDSQADTGGLSPNNLLLAAAIRVLGQPLGVGQGNNPTCQAARGISLWSLHAPGLLLGMAANAARDGTVECRFEGQVLSSGQIVYEGSYDTRSLSVDPLSSLLVPHLDRLYFRMQQLAAYRGEDPHRWINPALYGRWVPTQFESVLDPASGAVRDHGGFVRRFFATHHPDYNEGHELLYPNPVGLMVTNVHGRLLGPHAVSIQRIRRDPDGALRIYFFNPNTEGRQDWGMQVRPSVRGHGEAHGESSLPFGSFVSRMYAFHYDPYEMGEVYAVPSPTVEEVGRMARESWAREMPWLDS